MKMKLEQIPFYRKGILKLLMRTYIFLFCTTVFSFGPTDLLSQNVKITVDNDKTISVDEVFEMIKSQTDYSFIYQENLFQGYPKVTLKKGNIRVNKLLEKSLPDGQVIYRFLDENTISVAKKKSSTFQEITLTGRVTDAQGVPIPGISVIVSTIAPSSLNASKDFFIRGTSTDFDGNFSIEAEPGYYLAAGGLGYEFFTQQITNGLTELTIVLKDRAAELDEVVLVGYGSTRRGEVTSSVSSVKSKELSKTIVGAPGSFDSGLAGLIKGVNIKQTSGQPGARIDINVRGFTSPFSDGDNNPLFVIDGVPFQASAPLPNDETRFAPVENPLLSINPNDIESIDVLKDAAATSIYGSRGANGVIIVKTKNGKRSEAASITFSASTTFAQPTQVFDWLNASEYREFLDVYISNTVDAVNLGNAGGTNVFTLLGFANIADIGVDFATLTATYNGLNDSYFGTADTDWNDVVYRDLAASQEYNFSIRGGSEKTNYFFSTRFNNQEGLVRNEERKQYGLRFGLDSDLNDKITIGTNINLSFSNNFRGYDGFDNGGLDTRPDVEAFDENGDPAKIEGTFFGFPSFGASPFARFTQNRNEDIAYNVLGNVYLEVEPVKNLKLRAELNGSLFLTESSYFTPDSVVGQDVPAFGLFASSDNSRLQNSNVSISNITTDLTANYSKLFGKHSFDALLGFSWNRVNTNRDIVFWQGFPDDFVLTTATDANRFQAKSELFTESGLNSGIGRVVYNYDSKYFLTASVRTDKSSRFGPDNQLAVFPALSAGWNISNESFLEDSNLISNLRLRASVGESGSTNVGDFAYLQFFGSGFRDGSLYNGGSAVGLLDELPNPSIGWEETTEFNIGLDFSFFKSRLRGSIDVYDRKTDGALIASPFPLETGARTFTSNFADLTNKGFEIDLSGDIIRTKDFTWAASFNISQNRNKLTRLPDDTSDFVDDRYEVGREINIIRGFILEGIYQTQQEIDDLNAVAPGGLYNQTGGNYAPGDYRFRDVNGDGIITVEGDGREILGSSQPDFFGGFNTSFRYKGFELSALFNFSQGGESTIQTDFFFPNLLNPTVGANTIQRFNVQNRWSPDNRDATLPRLVAKGLIDRENGFNNTNNVYDVSFVRLRNLQLSYNLPNSVLEKMGINGLSIFASGSNLALWTDFPGLDPEAATGGASPFATRNGNPYPNARSWSLGFNINF